MTSRLKEGTNNTDDIALIKEHPFFKLDEGDICLRLAVVPMAKGVTTLWLSAVPGSLDCFKKK
jgi:hypothetical protein